MGKVVVIGSSNTDMVVKTERIPALGETILGGDFFMNQGGKGANQAVAVFRMKGDLVFITHLGDDLFGKNTVEHFKKEGIATDYIHLHPTEPSGTALITLSEKGENTIVVVPGANDALRNEHIDSAIEEIKSADYILMQLEIPIDTVEYVAKMAYKYGRKIILNPAPAQNLSNALYSILDIITPNETEAELLTGIKVVDTRTAEKAAVILRKKGVHTVIITLGVQGAFVMSNTFCGLIEVRKVQAVDTTAAGDTFNGVLASALANGKDIEEAVKFANLAASISVTKLGAQKSIPYLEDIVSLKKFLIS